MATYYVSDHPDYTTEQPAEAQPDRVVETKVIDAPDAKTVQSSPVEVETA